MPLHTQSTTPNNRSSDQFKKILFDILKAVSSKENAIHFQEYVPKADDRSMLYRKKCILDELSKIKYPIQNIKKQMNTLKKDIDHLYDLQYANPNKKYHLVINHQLNSSNIYSIEVLFLDSKKILTSKKDHTYVSPQTITIDTNEFLYHGCINILKENFEKFINSTKYINEVVTNFNNLDDDEMPLTESQIFPSKYSYSYDSYDHFTDLLYLIQRIVESEK